MTPIKSTAMYDLAMFSGILPDGSRTCSFYVNFKEDSYELKVEAIFEIYNSYLILSKKVELTEKDTRIIFENQDNKETWTLEDLVKAII